MTTCWLSHLQYDRESPDADRRGAEAKIGGGAMEWEYLLVTATRA